MNKTISILKIFKAVFLLSKKKSSEWFKWIIHLIYGVMKIHSLRSAFQSILTPVEWKFTIQRVESRPVHSIFTPKEVITEPEVTPQGETSVWVKIHFIFLESK